jgi:hypothetical protein
MKMPRCVLIVIKNKPENMGDNPTKYHMMKSKVKLFITFKLTCQLTPKCCLFGS